ncbi:MAG TPA: UDP-N-acetylmuramate--L-alanine ligase [Gemmatimonadales bacterium]|nr:UDP-N-acetylmuramate--L-alanine ligase [Gemmatimonadales bacterium]
MNLFDSADPRPVHFLGIGGAGMSALALLACRRGVTVTGCDADPSGAADLAALGVRVFAGHDVAHVDGVRAVVHTAAVPAGHAELARAHALGVSVVPRKVALGELVGGRRTVAVSGTHGKTTTTVMTTEALAAMGTDPTGLAGGRVSGWGGNARIGSDALFVVEADEYDQAFLTLQPTVAIVNNVEPDHLECYGSEAALHEAFVEFAGRASLVLAGADDPGAREVADRIGAKARTFGIAADADIRIVDIRQSAGETSARVIFPGGEALALTLRVPGMHNLRNAVGALAAALHFEPCSGEAAVEALAAFAGVGRRFERLGEFGGVEIVDDYAHHPSELVATLAAARQAFPGRRLVAVFQPHLFSRTAAHGTAMGEALAAADLVVVTEIYPAREQPIAGVSGAQVAEAAERAGATTVFESDRPAVGRRVLGLLRPGDVVLTLGAGDITRVGPELVQWLRAA